MADHSSNKLMLSDPYKFRSDIWISTTPPTIDPAKADDFYYAMFWYQIPEDMASIKSANDRKLMVNLFMQQEDKSWKREWVDAFIIPIATLERIGGFYNIKGDEWYGYHQWAADQTGEHKDVGDPNTSKYYQAQGQVGVNEDNGKLRIVSVDNGTISFDPFA